jgi:signal transduction histidine kinase
MFQWRLGFALLVLTLLTLIQGGVAIWAIDGARQKVELGRLSSDLHTGFMAFSDAKNRLRTWLVDAQNNPNPDLDQRDFLLHEMRSDLQQLHLNSDRLAERTTQTNEQVTALIEERRAALVTFDRLFQAVEAAALSMSSRLVAERFEQVDGQSLQVVLADALARERTLLAQQRSDADRSMQQLIMLAVLATITLTLTILAVFWYFARALRRPIYELVMGAKAFQRGELTHRLDENMRDEFGRVAARMNLMADELSQHRQAEQDRQQHLEDLVEVRTRELEQALASLRQLGKQRQQLLEDISHELRTPTTSIRGEAEITLRQSVRSEPEYRQALQRIASDAAHLADVISDLLTMARSDMVEWQVQRHPLDPSVPLRDAIGQASTLGRLRNITLHSEQLTTATVLGDAQRLQQIYGILLDNAVQYSFTGGTVTITATIEERQGKHVWELCVYDQGIGLEGQDAQRLFERGYRGVQARSHRPDGQGVGLAIAMLLTRLHGGQLWLEPVAEGGCVARLQLPVHTLGAAPEG